MPRGRIKPSPLLVGALQPQSMPVSEALLEQTAHDAITATLEAYLQAWFTADIVGLERCLHPELTTRLLQSGLDTLESPRVHAHTRSTGIQAWLGACVHPSARQSEITILDVSGHSASARLLLNDWVSYVHLSFAGDRWAIVNVMWEWRLPRDRRSA